MPEDLTREELLRLYKSDIGEDVAERVEKRLIKRYSIAALVAVSLLSAMSGGFYAFASMMIRTQAEEQVNSLLDELLGDIADLVQEQRNRLADIADKRALAEVTLDVATNATAKANMKLGELETARAGLEQRIADLKARFDDFQSRVAEANDNFDKLNKQQEEQAIALKSELANTSVQIKEGLAAFSQLSAQVGSLAGTISQLAALPESTLHAANSQQLSKLAETRQRVDAITTQSTQVYETDPRARQTIFFQFSGNVTREQAREISLNLIKRGYVVPGEERAASDSPEVRYFYVDDTDLAGRVASDTMEILASLGWQGLSVKPVPMVDWPEAKPPQGTVELWLPLPRRGP